MKMYFFTFLKYVPDLIMSELSVHVILNIENTCPVNLLSKNCDKLFLKILYPLTSDYFSQSDRFLTAPVLHFYCVCNVYFV